MRVTLAPSHAHHGCQAASDDGVTDTSCHKAYESNNEARGRRVSAFRSKTVRPHLVQDHEGCLWKAANLKALSKAGFHVLKNYPKCLPDLNAIEGWWRRLRQLLNDSAPASCETRPMFLRRLRATAAWMNKHLRREAVGLCKNQKARANDVLRVQGAKGKW